MAANSANLTDTECIVNRWIVDYYLYLAIETFKTGQYVSFCRVRDVLENVMVRPFESTEFLPMKIWVLQFLCRINEGERLDLSYESDQLITPLESALMLLENLRQRCSIPQQEYDNTHTSLKDMIIKICIKNDEFERAKVVLNKQFPGPMVGKKAIFMGLIQQKSKIHEVIEQIDFRQFKEEMLTFCQRLYPCRSPFLHLAADRIIEGRETDRVNKAAGANVEEEPGSSTSLQFNSVVFVPCKHPIIQSRLEAAYQALAAGSDSITFTQIREEVEREEEEKKGELSLRLSPSPAHDSEQETNQDGLFQRDSGSPMEASPADQPPQTDAAPQTQAGSSSKTVSVPRNRRLHTVAQLVVEPDSQASSQCTAASQELEPQVRTEEPPQSPNTSHKKDSQSPITDCEVTKPSRTLPRRAMKRASTCLKETSTDDEEETPSSVTKRGTCVGKHHKQSNSSVRRNSTKSKRLQSDSETDPKESSSSFIRPSPQKTPQKQTSAHRNSDPGDADEICIEDSSLESSPDPFPRPPVPQKSSTPHKEARNKDSSTSKWKQLFNNAQESKETWNDEESYFSSRVSNKSNNSSITGHKKKMWSESETEKLKEGVKRFGEGNWIRIKDYYGFTTRTSVNLKDRWRTMKKLKLV